MVITSTFMKRTIDYVTTKGKTPDIFNIIYAIDDRGIISPSTSVLRSIYRSRSTIYMIQVHVLHKFIRMRLCQKLHLTE